MPGKVYCDLQFWSERLTLVEFVELAWKNLSADALPRRARTKTA